MSELADFRMEKDRFFSSSPQSPLEAEQKATFGGLAYFPENPGLDLELPLERYAHPDLVRMQTSTGDVQDYRKIGQVHFTLGSQAVTLQVYESAYGGDLFLPFVDGTAPAETYGSGRYLEPELVGRDRLRVDFNMAYNPYCAYNELWSCPIPPLENRTAVRIEAGEKRFH
jgi:uncharacterized protein (DUF1684 family)